MSSDEQQQFNVLRNQLEVANRNTEEVRSYLSTALGDADKEVRLYRNLFWGLLLFVALATIINLLQN